MEDINIKYTSLDSHVREKTSHHDGLAEDEPEAFIPQPGDGHIRGAKAGRDQQGMMGTLLILDLHGIVGQGDHADGIKKIPKDMAPLGHLIAPADLGAQQTREAAGHESQLYVTGDLHGDGGRQGIHREKVDAIGDAVGNHHALRIAFNERRRCTAPLIGHQEGRRFMTEVRDGQLAQGTLIPGERDGIVAHARASVRPRDILSGHASPC